MLVLLILNKIHRHLVSLVVTLLNKLVQWHIGLLHKAAQVVVHADRVVSSQEVVVARVATHREASVVQVACCGVSWLVLLLQNVDLLLGHHVSVETFGLLLKLHMVQVDGSCVVMLRLMLGLSVHQLLLLSQEVALLLEHHAWGDCTSLLWWGRPRTQLLEKETLEVLGCLRLSLRVRHEELLNLLVHGQRVGHHVRRETHRTCEGWLVEIVESALLLIMLLKGRDTVASVASAIVGHHQA